MYKQWARGCGEVALDANHVLVYEFRPQNVESGAASVMMSCTVTVDADKVIPVDKCTSSFRSTLKDTFKYFMVMSTDDLGKQGQVLCFCVTRRSQKFTADERMTSVSALQTCIVYPFRDQVQVCLRKKKRHLYHVSLKKLYFTVETGYLNFFPLCISCFFSHNS